jgi:hypothetical protein
VYDVLWSGQQRSGITCGPDSGTYCGHPRAHSLAQAVNERPAEHATPFIEVIARNGPHMGPGVAVDVIIQLRDAEGRTFLLRVLNQLIQREG